ncbi:MAG: YIP1 family protein [Acidobacteriota bacterium]
MSSPSDIPIAPSVGEKTAYAKLNTFQRLIGTLFSPSETFRDINAKPDLVLPLLLTLVIAVAGNFIILQRLKPDWEALTRRAIEQQLERQGKSLADLSEQERNAVDMQTKYGSQFGKIFAYVGPALAPIFVVILALIFWGAVSIMGGITKFTKVLSITAYITCMVGGLVQSVLSILVAFLRNPEDIDLLKGGIAVTNPGMLMPKGASPVLVSLLTRLDIFSIWFLILMSIGLVAVSEKLKPGTAKVIVFALWGIYVLVVVGFAALTN